MFIVDYLYGPVHELNMPADADRRIVKYEFTFLYYIN